MKTPQLVTIARTAVRIGREKEISFLSGSIAFFAFLSIFPAVLLILALGSFFGGEQFANRIVGFVDTHLSSSGSQLLTEALEDTTGAAGASVVGVVVLLWSTLKVFRAVDVAFNRVYQDETSVSILTHLRNGLVTILAIGLGIVLIALVQQLLVLIPIESVLYSRLVGWTILIAGLVIVLAPLYYVMAPIQTRPRDVVPGTVTAVIGFLLLQELFAIYASQASQYQALGIVGVVLLFLLWLYFGAFVLLSGAILNAAIYQTRVETGGQTQRDGQQPSMDDGQANVDDRQANSPHGQDSTDDRETDSDDRQVNPEQRTQTE